MRLIWYVVGVPMLATSGVAAALFYPLFGQPVERRFSGHSVFADRHPVASRFMQTVYPYPSLRAADCYRGIVTVPPHIAAMPVAEQFQRLQQAFAASPAYRCELALLSWWYGTPNFNEDPHNKVFAVGDTFGLWTVALQEGTTSHGAEKGSSKDFKPTATRPTATEVSKFEGVWSTTAAPVAEQCRFSAALYFSIMEAATPSKPTLVFECGSMWHRGSRRPQRQQEEAPKGAAAAQTAVGVGSGEDSTKATAASSFYQPVAAALDSVAWKCLVGFHVVYSHVLFRSMAVNIVYSRHVAATAAGGPRRGGPPSS